MGKRDAEAALVVFTFVVAASPGWQTMSVAQEGARNWAPATVYNHESSMALGTDGALVDPHPRSNPSLILTGTDGGKDSDDNLPFPVGVPIPDSYGQAVTVTSRYLFVTALAETNQNSLLGGGAVYVYERRGREWVFSQKLNGSEAGEPWQFEAFSPFRVALPGFFYLGADEDDLLVGVFNHLNHLDDGVFAYRLKDESDDGVDNPVWVFTQKLTRPTPADYPPEFFGTRVAMDREWAFVVSNHEDHDLGVDNPFDLAIPGALSFSPGPGPQETTVSSSTIGLDPDFGPDLGLGDDDSAEITVPVGFPFLGTTYTSLWVNSDGTVSLGVPEVELERTATRLILGAPRIAALLTDLDPSSGGSVHADVRADRVVVTWDSVPEYGTANANTFQVVLHSDGVVDLVYERVDAAFGVVGLAEGLLQGPVHEIDLSADLPMSTEAGAIIEEFRSRRVGNAGVVWAFRQDQNGLWHYTQRITQPDRITQNGLFGNAGLAVQGAHALVTGSRNGYVFELVEPQSPGATWVWTGQILSVFDNPERDVRDVGVLSGMPAIDQGWLIMGAPQSSDFSDPGHPLTGRGAALFYRWDAPTRRWSFRQEIVPNGPQPGAGFGLSTDVKGDLAIVGASQFDVDSDGNSIPDVTDAGAAYLFQRTGQTWIEVTRLEHANPQAGDVFSGSLGCVSLGENHAAVGTFINSALFNSNPFLWGTQAGSAVVFDRRPPR